MEEARLSEEKLNFRSLAPILLIVLVDLIGLSIIIPLLPLYAARYGATPLLTGLLGSTYPLMQFIGAPILGRLSDRFGRRPILLISQIGTFAGFLLLAFANSLPLLFLSRIIDGLSGANISTAQAIVADVTTPRTRTQGLGLIGAAFGLGFVLGPILAFIVLSVSGQSFVAVALTAAVFSLTSIALTYFTLQETRRTGEDIKQRSPFTLQAMLEALKRPAIGFLLILMFMQQLAFGGYEQMFSLFTLNRLGLSASDNSALFIYLGLLIVFIQGGLVGRWSKRYGDRWLILLGLSMLSLGLLFTALTPQIPVPWYERARLAQELSAGNAQNLRIDLPDDAKKGLLGLLWIVVASIPAAVGGGVLQPSINSLITQFAAKDETGGILGISSAFLSAANALAPLFFGFLFQTLGASAPFIIGGILLAFLFFIGQKAVPYRSQSTMSQKPT